MDDEIINSVRSGDGGNGNNSTDDRSRHDDDHEHHPRKKLEQPECLSNEFIAQCLFQPDPRTKCIEENMSIDSTVSFFPWKVNAASTASDEIGSAPTNNRYQTDKDSNVNGSIPSNPRKSRQHPNAVQLPSYLDLRRQQNVRYVNNSTRTASKSINEWLQMDPGCETYIQTFKSIERELQRALKLIPDDIESLLLYSQILLRLTMIRNEQLSSSSSSTLFSSSPSKTSQWPDLTPKLKKLLHKVQQIDPDNVRAKTMLSRLEQHLTEGKWKSNSNNNNNNNVNGNGYNRPLNSVNSSARKQQQHLSARESSAFQDALMERRLLMGDDTDNTGNNNNDDNDDNDGDNHLSKSSSSTRHHRSVKSKEKRRKRKYREYDDDSEDDDDDDDSRSRRKKKKRKRDRKKQSKKKDRKKKKNTKKHKKKRENEDDSISLSSSDDDDSR